MILVDNEVCEVKGLGVDVLCEVVAVLIEIERQTGAEASGMCRQIEKTIEIYKKGERIAAH